MSSASMPSADLLTLLMRASSAVAERINAAVVDAGNPGLRPVHGLVFTRIAAGGASINQIADHLGITKQSAAAIVDGLEGSGHVSRRPHPSDRRAWLVELTPRGREVTAVAADALRREESTLEGVCGADCARIVGDALRYLGGDTKPRPVW